jgi:heptosyltransferase-1
MRAIRAGDCMNKTLVIKLGALGDIALCLPLLRQMARHGDGPLTIVTTPPFVGLVQAIEVGNVVMLPNRSTLAVVRLGLKLRREGFQRIVDLQAKRPGRLLTWIAGKQAQRVGTWPRWPYTHAVVHPAHHPEQRFPELAKLIGLPPELPTPVPVAESIAAKVREWLAGNGLTGQKLALFHAGCSRVWTSKRWPEQHFEKLAQMLSGAGYQVVWLGAKEEEELNVRLSRIVGVNATGAFKLPDLLALAREGSFAITNDSGPMHLLAIGGLPVYALFGPIDPRRSHAWGQLGRVLERPLPCRPCYSKKCLLPGESHDCLAGLLPEHVLEKLRADGWLNSG